jgi:hypothetical protein
MRKGSAVISFWRIFVASSLEMGRQKLADKLQAMRWCRCVRPIDKTSVPVIKVRASRTPRPLSARARPLSLRAPAKEGGAAKKCV